MKKILFLLSAAIVLLASCEGPAGRDGLDGRDGMDMMFLNYTVEEDDWVLVGRPGELGSYYTYRFNAPELTKRIFEYGSVTGDIWLNNNERTPLSHTEFMGENVYGDYFYFSDKYSFSYGPGVVTFYVDYSDFETGTFPPACDFRICLIW